MKKLAVFLVCILSFAFNTGAQSWLWAKSTKNPGGIDGWLVKNDLNNNIVAVTLWSGPMISFGQDTFHNAVNGSYKTAIVKYDTAGNILWSDANTVGESYPLSLTTDKEGNAYFFGYFWTDSIRFGAHLLINDRIDSAIYPYQSISGCYFIIKYGPSGNIIWAKTGDYVTPASGSGGGIATDLASNVYITGTYMNATIKIGPYTLINSVNEQYGSYEMFIAKYDALGNVIWAESYGGTRRDFGEGIAVGNDNNIYVTGAYSSSGITFDTITLAYSSSDTGEAYVDVFLVKLDTAGHSIWAKSSAGSAHPDGIAIDNDNNIYISGFINDTAFIAFDSDTLITSDTAFRFCDFIAKFDTGGNVSRLSEIHTLGINGASTRVYGLTADACNNIWVCGKMQKDTFGIRLDSTTILLAPTGSNDPWFFAGYDADGALIYAQSFKTGGDDYSSLSADKLGNVYVCDDVQSVSLVFGNDTVKPFGGEQMFIAKYRSGICNTDTVLRTAKQIAPLPEVTVYPNPAQNTITIQYSGPMQQNATASIYDITGRLMGLYPLTGSSTTISVQNLAPGIYQCRVMDGRHNMATKKLVIMH